MPSERHTDVDRFFHINVNCSDFEQSLAFYRLIGFEVILDFDSAPGSHRTFGQVGLGPILNLPEDCAGRAALLSLSDDIRAMRLDLIEWKRPTTPNKRRADLSQPGMARICLKSTNADAVYERLVAAGHRTYSSPTQISLAGSLIKVFCVEDPDGVVIEFMQFLGVDQSGVPHM